MSEPGSPVEVLLSTCPQPGKHRYLDEATARAQARRLEHRRGALGRLHPYLCRCRLWHLTHDERSA